MNSIAQHSNPAALSMQDVAKTYGRGPAAVRALDRVTIEFEPRTFTAVMGPSGSGKSTFLQIAAGLERPSRGRVSLAGRDLGELGATALTEFRRDQVGFVFQDFNLMPTLTVAQNVVLPVRLGGRKVPRDRVAAVLERLGLGDRMRHRPHQLSGGERQRVAVARALVCEPAVVFADEPTGALDLGTADEILGLLRECVELDGRTLVMVTHDPNAAARAERVLFLANGTFVDELSMPSSEQVAARITELSDLVAA
jgi:putative ABC transport system ATP-binding protein